MRIPFVVDLDQGEDGRGRSIPAAVLPSWSVEGRRAGRSRAARCVRGIGTTLAPRIAERGNEPSPLQTVPESFPAAGQPTLEGPDRPAEPGGGHRAGSGRRRWHGLDRESVRHSAAASISWWIARARSDRSGPVATLRDVGFRVGPRGVLDPSFLRASFARAIARRPGNATALQPGAERVADPERTGLAGQDQERRLEGVVGRVLVDQGRAGDPEDHRPVPLDQRGEGQFGRSPARVANRSRSWPSDKPPAAPTEKSVRRCRVSIAEVPLAKGVVLRGGSVLRLIPM